jgi:type II secretion system protein H
MRRCGGFTLLELLIVIVIMGILFSIATLQFSSMTSGRNIAKEAQQLLSDIYTVRTQAMYSKQRTGLTFPTGSSYSFSRYSSMNDAAGSSTGTTTVRYALTSADGSSIAGKSLIFDREGMAAYSDGSALGSPLTVWVNPTNSGASADCVAIDTARTNLGRMLNGKCVIK